MKRCSLSLLILISFIPQNVCAQDKPQISQESRYGNVILLTQWSENDMGFVTNILINALEQQAGIIIIQKGLITILAQRIKNRESLHKAEVAKEKAFIAKMIERAQELNEEISAIEATVEQDVPWSDVNKYLDFLVSNMNFNPTEWEIYNVESLFVFVPKKYKRERGIVSDDETSMVRLGLKTNRMERVRNISSLKDLAQYASPSSASVEITGTLPGLLPQIFLTPKDEDVKGQEMLLPLWNVYGAGHGVKNQYIMGLTPQDFKNTLRFFNNVPTNLFVYATCFGGGENLNAPYLTKDIPDIYNFPIVSVASVAAPLIIDFISMTISKKGLALKLALSFTDFFQKAAGTKFKYKDLVSNVIGSPRLKEERLLNQVLLRTEPDIPLIRGRGTGWFDLSDFDIKTEKITSIKAAVARAEKQTINIKEEKRFLFLATDFVDTTLNIAPENLTIIPIDPLGRPTSQYIKKITNNTTINIIDSFFPTFIFGHQIVAQYFVDDVSGTTFGGGSFTAKPSSPHISKVAIFLNTTNKFAKDSDSMLSACFMGDTPEGQKLFVYEKNDIYKVDGAREKEYENFFDSEKEKIVKGRERINLGKLKKFFEKRYPSPQQKSSEPVASTKSKRHKKIVAQKIQNHRTALA
jgi:hypothetical protein